MIFIRSPGLSSGATHFQALSYIPSASDYSVLSFLTIASINGPCFSNVRNPNAGDVPIKMSIGSQPLSGPSGSTAEAAENAERKDGSFELYMSHRRVR